jgi:oxygen-independent coproporphyrinogen-3 oxidase
VKNLGVDIPGQRSRIGIYVHVPFCTSICSYCDFIKTSRFDRADADVFFERCLLQLRELLDTHFFQEGSCTLYFGGGTPGLFPAERFEPIIMEVAKRFEIEECTLETNPALTTAKRFLEFRSIGIDRVTIGAQSLCSNVLQVFGRRHSPNEGLDAVRMARAAGFDQVQVDLIYGLRDGERTTRLDDEVRAFVAAGATGISGYALSLEKRTRLFCSNISDEDVAAREYVILQKTCLELGMKQNETSNFSFFEAKHNNIYWHGWPYVGVGTAAHGLTPPGAEYPFGRRYAVGKIRDEISPGNDFLPYKQIAGELFEVKWEAPRTADDYLHEMIFTLLRTPQGIPFLWLQNHAPSDVSLVLRQDAKIARACEEGRLFCDEDSLRLLGSEFLLGDSWALHVLAIVDQMRSDRSKFDHCSP